MDLPYMQELKELHEFLSKEITNFPTHCCSISSRLVKRIIGLQEIAGYYHYLETGYYRRHNWNYDKEHKLWIDITAQQFQKSNRPILISRTDINTYEPIQEYVQETHRMKDEEIFILDNDWTTTAKDLLEKYKTNIKFV